MSQIVVVVVVVAKTGRAGIIVVVVAVVVAFMVIQFISDLDLCAWETTSLSVVTATGDEAMYGGSDVHGGIVRRREHLRRKRAVASALCDMVG